VPDLPAYAERVLEAVERIPPGRVMSYGDIAEWLGEGGPRQVGAVLSAYGGGVPWWRVLRADGTHIPELVARAVENWRAEGTPLRADGERVDMRRARWGGAIAGTPGPREPWHADPAWRPSRAELESAYGRTIPDLIAPDLKVLLVGVNPGLWSGLIGVHFGNPANRLWRTLHEAGFTDRLLHPTETGALLAAGIGVTNLVAAATARADELPSSALRAGVDRLDAVCRRWRPGWVAFLGLGAYRTAYRRPRAAVGPQEGVEVGGRPVWLLPNPSGLNASYQQPALTEAYAALRRAAYG
jgi:TDG/mug DNA glycosylase family protein